MGYFTFIVGGVRSGKSSYAVEIAKQTGTPVTFIATAIAFDEEMKRRIDRHKSSRPSNWHLIEESKDIAKAIHSLQAKTVAQTILIDCLGIFVTNLLLDEVNDEDILKIMQQLIDEVCVCAHEVIIVSNEVGQGVVPENKLARRFRDLVGYANQMIAKSADKVIFMQCGIPMIIKEGK